MKIVIAGGGIGGLAAALACRAFGHDVAVAERAPALQEVGAGLQMSPNAMKVLRALDLTDALAPFAFEPEAAEMRLGRSGRSLFSIPLGEAAERRWGAPYWHLHRADLLGVLAAALEARAPGALHLGAEAAGVDQDRAGASLRLAAGGALEGDVAIGADGVRSAIRQALFGPDAPRYTGQTAWRAVTPLARLEDHAPPPTACVWAGPGRHAVTYRLRAGELANFVGVVERSAEAAESWLAEGRKEDALAEFAGWRPEITTLIERADTLHRWAIHDRAPLPHWTDGRAALLGDACHPMPPFMAQGAAMAIEDAWVLARTLTETGDPAAALRRYEALRKPRATRVQRLSVANGALFHRRTRPAQLLSYGPAWIAGRVAPGLIAARQDWLYGADVTAPLGS